MFYLFIDFCSILTGDIPLMLMPNKHAKNTNVNFILQKAILDDLAECPIASLSNVL